MYLCAYDWLLYYTFGFKSYLCTVMNHCTNGMVCNNKYMLIINSQVWCDYHW